MPSEKTGPGRPATATSKASINSGKAAPSRISTGIRLPSIEEIEAELGQNGE